jgi:hypothetical protein
MSNEVNTNEIIIQLQATVLSLSNKIEKLGEVINNVGGYAKQIDQAAGARIARLEKHNGIELPTAPAEAAPVEVQVPEAAPAENQASN